MSDQRFEFLVSEMDLRGTFMLLCTWWLSQACNGLLPQFEDDYALERSLSVGLQHSARLHETVGIWVAFHG